MRAGQRHVADGRAGEEADGFSDRSGPRRGQRERPQEIGADGVDVETGIVGGQRLGGAQQVFARDVDRRIHRRLLQRLQQQAGLAAGAAAVIDDIGARPRKRGDFGAVGAQEGDLDARNVVLGHLEDGLEQVRAALVIDEAAGQPLRHLREAGEHGLPEVARRRRKVMDLH